MVEDDYDEERTGRGAVRHPGHALDGHSGTAEERRSFGDVVNTTMRAGAEPTVGHEDMRRALTWGADDPDPDGTGDHLGRPARRAGDDALIAVLGELDAVLGELVGVGRTILDAVVMAERGRSNERRSSARWKAFVEPVGDPGSLHAQERAIFDYIRAAGRPVRYRDAARRAWRATTDERPVGGTDAYDGTRARLMAGFLRWVEDRPGYVEVRTVPRRRKRSSGASGREGAGDRRRRPGLTDMTLPVRAHPDRPNP